LSRKTDYAKSHLFKNYIMSRSFLFGSVYSLLLIFIPANSLLAQFRDFRFRSYTIEHGLSQSSIYVAFQDQMGFMWFGTEDGLNRIDGYNFKIYKTDPADGNSISYNYVKAIIQDREGRLWFGTYGGGLNRFISEYQVFEHYRMEQKPGKSLSNDFISSLFESKSGDIWIGTNDGLNQLNPKTGEIHVFKEPETE